MRKPYYCVLTPRDINQEMVYCSNCRKWWMVGSFGRGINSVQNDWNKLHKNVVIDFIEGQTKKSDQDDTGIRT